MRRRRKTLGIGTKLGQWLAREGKANGRSASAQAEVILERERAEQFLERLSRLERKIAEIEARPVDGPARRRGI